MSRCIIESCDGGCPMLESHTRHVGMYSNKRQLWYFAGSGTPHRYGPHQALLQHRSALVSSDRELPSSYLLYHQVNGLSVIELCCTAKGKRRFYLPVKTSSYTLCYVTFSPPLPPPFSNYAQIRTSSPLSPRPHLISSQTQSHTHFPQRSR